MYYNKCIKCGNEAKWYSDKYVSPLCNECAVEETKRLVEENNARDEIGVGDWFRPIVTNDQGKATFVKGE